MFHQTRRHILRTVLLTAAICAAPLALTAQTAAPTPAIAVENPWARASAGQVANGAAYLTIVNKSNTLDRLLSASASVSEKVELHTHINEGGVMQMRQVQGIDINPGEPAVLQPGGLHIMLLGLKAPLKAGEKFPLTLTFEKAGKLDVTVDVKAPGASAPTGGHHSKH